MIGARIPRVVSSSLSSLILSFRADFGLLMEIECMEALQNKVESKQETNHDTLRSILAGRGWG